MLLDYIYTGEICASKGLMQEFEICLKELGILGTHSYTFLSKSSESQDFNVIQPSNPVEFSSSHNSIVEEVIACGSQSQLMNNTTHSLTSESCDMENAISEEEDFIPTEPFEKYVCKQKYLNKKQLKSPLESHSQQPTERPYVCPICQKSFRHLNVLRTHSRVHTGNQ